ncbi:MAG: hypothetical protein AAF146_02370, partial [Bacteroidota bacterium]
MSLPSSDRLQQLFGFLEARPADPFILFAVAKEYEGLGAPERALAYYLQLRQADPKYVGLYYHLGKLYEKKQDWTAALEAYDAGIAVAKAQGDRPPARSGRGDR